MIIKTTKELIFNTEAKHIAFSINTEGVKYTGFAEKIAPEYWSELERIDNQEIGSVISKTIGDKTYHALVCHTVKKGWEDDQIAIIKQCFDAIPANGETIATVAIGTRFQEKILGADFYQIICGMHDSDQSIMLHTGYNLDDIIAICRSVKQKRLEKQKFIRNITNY